MRLLALSLGVLVVAVPASAAVVDPQALVLRQGDVPSRFTVDPRESRVTSNEFHSRHGLGKLVARTGRVTGYRRVFRVGDSRVNVIQSGVDVFRDPAGPRIMLARDDAEIRRINRKVGVINAYGREKAGLGSASWVYWSGYPGYYVFVVWCQGRLQGWINSWDVGREGTLKLARIQQRRMAAALR